jgi:hypothetical protein
VEDGGAVGLGGVDQWRDAASARSAGVPSRNGRVVRERTFVSAGRGGTSPST